jgi:hypothetical protein
MRKYVSHALPEAIAYILKLSEWRFMMRRICIRSGKRLGVIFLTLGALIILALIMPPAFWAFALGATLICAGIAILSN